MERDIVEVLREDAGVIRPNMLTDAADVIERLRARVGQLEADASALAAERDEARREICSLGPDEIEYRIQCAKERGWDCYKEDRK